MFTEFGFPIFSIIFVILFIYLIYKNHEEKKKPENIKKAIMIYLYSSIFFLAIALFLILIVIFFQSQITYLQRGLFSLFIILSFIGFFYSIIGWEDLRIKSKKEISSK